MTRAPASGRGVHLALLPILLLGFWLRFRAADHPYISQWDEAYHALVAKNMIAHPLEPTLYEEKVLPADDHDWTKTRVWLHKPPLPLWLMSAGLAAFGEDELSFRLPAVVLDTAAILLVYLLALELFGRLSSVTGPAAALLYALNPLMIRLVSGRIPDDTPHAVNVFFITCTAYLFVVCARKNSRACAAAAGFSLGLGTLCMSAVALLGLAAPLPVLFAARGTRGTVRLLAVAFFFFLAAALPWPLYALSRWPELWRHESALQVDHLFTTLDGHAHAWWWYLEMVRFHYGGNAVLAWAGACAALAYGAREASRGKAPGLAAALCWVVLPYAFFSSIATKLYSYVCVAVPGLCLLAGFGLTSLWTARRGRFRTAVLAALVLSAAQTAWVAAERARADYSACPWNALYDYPAFRRAMLALRREPSPKVLLNVGDSKAPQAMYYSGAAAYQDAPSPALVRGLLDRGLRVYILLDERRRGLDEVLSLKKAGLFGRVRFLPLSAPRPAAVRHPYEA